MTKVKIQFEFPLHCQSEILFEYLATPEGLAEWFADEVHERGDDFYFNWDMRKKPHLQDTKRKNW